MKRFDEGDTVRIDIPDQADPDHDRLHGETGEISSIIEDDAHAETGDERDRYIFRVKIGSETVDVRWRDLRPV